MSRAVVSLISRMGFDESRAGYEERMGFKPMRFNPATPIPEARLRRRHARLRRTPSEIRADIRRTIVTLIGNIADPEHAWHRDDLEHDKAVYLNRYRLALSSMRCEPRPLEELELDIAAERALAIAAE